MFLVDLYMHTGILSVSVIYHELHKVIQLQPVCVHNMPGTTSLAQIPHFQICSISYTLVRTLS